ncbi:MAG: ParA family protein [Magnetococcales bacterium]|nr:ParA family protein [Magnetococcales bacterium]MBF0322423.1 ParA family protein [Magnetococcales bacterium]
MGRILAVANQKGGVGKTATAVNLAAALGAAEKRVLLVDCDPQGNATTALGSEKTMGHGTVYDLLSGARQVHEVVRRVAPPYLDLVASVPDLSGAEVELVHVPQREFRLRHALQAGCSAYDLVLLDCPPSLGLLTLNALVAADGVLAPLQCEFHALEGLAQLIRTVEIVRERLNPGLTLAGIVLTMYDAESGLSRQVAEEVRQHFGDQVFATVIPRDRRLAEAPGFGKPAVWYDVRSAGALAYLGLAQEILAGRGLKEQDHG